MLFSMYILKDRIGKLSKMNEKLKPEQEIIGERPKVFEFAYDMILALNELKASLPREASDYEMDIRFINSKVKEAGDALTTTDLKDIINSIQIRFQNWDFTSEPSRYDMSDKYRYYNELNNEHFDYSFINKVMNAINNENRRFTVFDPQCYDGSLLAQMKERNKDLIAYGLEKDNYNAEIAKTKIDKVIKGQLKGSRIKNDAFDIAIANCPMLPTLADNLSGSGIRKAERDYLDNMMKYLKPGGVMIIALPYYRMYKDVCMYLAKNFDYLEVSLGCNNVLQIVGKRSANKEINEIIYHRLRECFNINNIDFIEDLTIEPMRLSGSYIEIDIFKGSVLDMDELFSIVQNSGCIDSFFEKQKVDKIHENAKKPLLPFNVGQIGLVLTSGCLDGVIDEGDGHCHLVKGRVSKKSDKERDVSDGVVEETEIVSNRVEINILLPNGDFKTLT